MTRLMLSLCPRLVVTPVKRCLFYVVSIVARFAVKFGYNLLEGRFTKPLFDYFYQSLRPKGVVAVPLNGMMYFVNADYRGMGPKLLLLRQYEEKQISAVHKLINRGDVFVDVGANLGLYALSVGRLLSGQGMVLAFEPDPRNLALLEAGVEASKLSNVIVTKLALTDAPDCTLRLYKDPRSLSRTSMGIDVVRGKAGYFDVEATTLDAFLAQRSIVNNIDFIKIDVEGGDGKVLLGSQSTIRAHHPNLLVEYWASAMKSCGTTPEVFIDSILRHGYLMWACELTYPAKPIRPISRESLLVHASEHPRRGLNIFAAHRPAICQVLTNSYGSL